MSQEQNNQTLNVADAKLTTAGEMSNEGNKQHNQFTDGYISGSEPASCNHKAK